MALNGVSGNQRKPNIVFVLTDDQGYGDLGCTGNQLLQTPHIDQFYESSVRFTDFHVGPTCAPTRSGLLTGHFANSTGVWHTVGGRSLLRKDEWTLASALKENGYSTGIFGKWHLGDNEPYRPQDRGFDTTVVHGGGGIGQTPDFWGNDYFDDTYEVNGEPRKFEGYCTDVFFDQSLQYIERNKDQPFFCYISTNAPHLPYNVEKRYSDLYEGQVPDARARFYGMITNIDENFGRLITKLTDLDLLDNTIVIFMTDNGTSGGAAIDEQYFVIDGYNAGLRGIKNTPYDGGHRVPFFMQWPAGGIAQGKDVDELTANVDFMPTLLDLCGIAVPDGHKFHGKSLRPLLYDHDSQWEDRVLVTDSQRKPVPVKWRESAVMTKRWRLINGKELYDILADREQRHDIADDFPNVVTELRAAYEQWWELVSGKFEEEIPISVGEAVHNQAFLVCHDWRNEDGVLPYQQGEIRNGMKANGYWEIDVAQSGEYKIELRRWPQEADRALTAGIDGDDVEWSRKWISNDVWYWYSGGIGLDIQAAKLRIGENEYTKPVTPDLKAASFTVQLLAGPAHLQAWFIDRHQQAFGAYYVYVTRV